MTEFLKKISKADIRNVLAIIIVIGSFTTLGILQVKPVPTENKDILNIGIGFILGGALSGVVGYFFGSSKQNKPDAE